MSQKKMKNTIAPRILFISIASFLVACGGGGGGTSSGGSGGGGIGRDSSSGVRVLHGAVDGSPVDLLSSLSGEPLETKIHFADSKGYRTVPDGAQTVSITRALNHDKVLDSFSLISSGRDAYSILLYGDSTTFGLRAKLIEDVIPQGFSGAAVRFVNGATGASALSVNVSGWSTGGTSVQFGSASDYIEAPAGNARITANRSADGLPAAALDYSLVAGRAYTVLIAGEVGYYSKGIVFVDR
jgi:hypothetical protein